MDDLCLLRSINVNENNLHEVSGIMMIRNGDVHLQALKYVYWRPSEIMCWMKVGMSLHSGSFTDVNLCMTSMDKTSVTGSHPDTPLMITWGKSARRRLQKHGDMRLQLFSAPKHDIQLTRN
jgi:hypothetical protein